MKQKKQKEQKTEMPLHRRIDGLLVIAVLGAASLLIAAAIPVGCAVSLMGSYHRFVQDLGDSLQYARDNGTLELTLEGETHQAQMDQVEWLYQVISDAGMGAPLSQEPEGEPLSFSFGDGCALRVYPTKIDEPDGTQVDGAIISYLRADGSAFSYDTDQLAYSDVVSGIKAAAG